MNQLERLLRDIDPARPTALTPVEADALWANIVQRHEHQGSLATDAPDDVAERQAEISHIRQRALFASGAAVILLAALGVWVGVSATAHARRGESAAQVALFKALRGAKDISIHGRSGVVLPTANLVYSAGTTLSSLSESLPVYEVNSTVNSDQLSTLVSAANVPTGGTWSTVGDFTTYAVDASQGWSLSVASGDGTPPSFEYSSASGYECTSAAGAPIVPFDAAEATTWSDAFISALGYAPSSFGPPEGTSGSCNSGPFWQFSRALIVGGQVTGVDLSFGYSATTGSLDNASGPLITLGTATQIPLVSPLSAAQTFTSQNNWSGPVPAGLSSVDITLSSDTVQYFLYRQSSGEIDLVPTYIFSGTCSTQDQAYCSVYLFPESALGTSARTGAVQFSELPYHKH